MGNTNSRGCACGGSRERDDSESRIVTKTSSADGVGDARRNYKQAEIERMIEDAYFSQELATFATMRSSTNVDADEVWSSANAQDFFEGDDEDDEDAWREHYIKSGILNKDDEGGGGGDGGAQLFGKVGSAFGRFGKEAGSPGGGKGGRRGAKKGGKAGAGGVGSDREFKSNPQNDGDAEDNDNDSDTFAEGGESKAGGEQRSRGVGTIIGDGFGDFGRSMKSLPGRTVDGIKSLPGSVKKGYNSTIDGIRNVPGKFKAAGENFANAVKNAAEPSDDGRSAREDVSLGWGVGCGTVGVVWCGLWCVAGGVYLRVCVCVWV